MARRPPLSAPVPQPPKPAVPQPPGRAGKRSVVFWVQAEAREEFRVAVLRSQTTMQAACEDMLADWMRRQGVRG